MAPTGTLDGSANWLTLVVSTHETCDARALPLVGGESESVWKGGSRGGVAGGWNAACQSLVTWYIPGQTVQTAVLLRHRPNR